MQTPRVWPSVAVAVVLAWSFGAAPAAAAEPDKDKATSPAEKLRQTLDATVTLKIEKQPLAAALDMLKEKGGVNLVVDSLAIQQQLGWAPDQAPSPVNVDLKGVKLKSALRTVLEPYGLAYAAVGDTLIVTTEEAAADRPLQQRVSFRLDKVDLAQALKQLRRETGANVTLDSRVEKEAKTTVSLDLEDVPLETAVRLLAEMAGLKPVRVGGALFVTKKETATEIRGEGDGDVGPGQVVEEVMEKVMTPGGGATIIRRRIVRPAMPQPPPARLSSPISY
jgi:type II secretory pathway component GspD/PulD (secretin)